MSNPLGGSHNGEIPSVAVSQPYQYDPYLIDSFFPCNPECPNHVTGRPFNNAYGQPNVSGQVSCADCFLHHTIMKSIQTPVQCQHLHASSNCPNCYTQKWKNQSNSPSYYAPGVSPPLLLGHSPLGPNISPPLNTRNSPNIPFQGSPRYNSPHHTPYSSNPGSPCYHSNGFSNEMENRPVNSVLYQPTPYDNTTQQMPSNIEAMPYTKTRKNQRLQQQHQLSDTREHAQSKEVNTRRTLSLPLNGNKEHQNRKRGADDLCQVCGDRASGYHYNALTCEGCKGFFRRSINKKEPPYSCKFGGNCEMDTYTRRKCPECRLKKCKKVGMLEECLLTEIQCQSKRRSRNKNEPKTSTNSNSAPTPSKTNVEDKEKQNILKTPGNPPLSYEDQKLIRFVGFAFEEYRGNPEVIQRWTDYLTCRKDEENDEEIRAGHLIGISSCHVKALVEFTKKLPGFNRLTTEDQIAMLKGSVVNIMMLRNICSYNKKKNNLDISAILTEKALDAEHLKRIFQFCSTISRIELDQFEYGLLIAIILFDSDHQNATDKPRIDRYRDMYLSNLSRYCEQRVEQRPNAFARILSLITQLRTLCHTHIKMVAQFKHKDDYTPLLCEIWDLW